MPFLNTIDPPAHDQLVVAQAVPTACRSRVHIFFVNGLDPFGWGNVSGLSEYVQSLGYHKTYYGQLYHAFDFADEIHKIHEADPEARFALVGFSLGANVTRHLCHVAGKEDVPIDLLVYLGGNTLSDCPDDKPNNVTHIVNILATGAVWNGDHLEGADNVQYTGTWHFGSPSHTRTLEILAEELAKVAARVPIVVKAPPKSPFEEAPTPRPVKQASAAEIPADWKFLAPTPPAPADADEIGVNAGKPRRPEKRDVVEK